MDEQEYADHIAGLLGITAQQATSWLYGGPDEDIQVADKAFVEWAVENGCHSAIVAQAAIDEFCALDLMDYLIDVEGDPMGDHHGRNL